MVVWGGVMPRQTYCSVGTDNVAGARSAVEHLLKLGRRKIVFVGDPNVPELKLRYQGHVAGLSAFKGALKPRVVPAHLMAESSFEAVQAFIEEHGEFDGIFAATDVIALSALRALTAAGLKVPQDVSVVGYDDVALAAHANPPLTTVKQDFHAGAVALVDLLFKRLNGEQTSSVTLPTKLIVRESCGAALWRFNPAGSRSTVKPPRATRK
jgi:DNA-binding LacI/PurR family transcriptional regulator